MAVNDNNKGRWYENVDVFLNPNVPVLITYYTSTGSLVTTTVIFRDVFDVDSATFLVLANGVLIPLENLVMVHAAESPVNLSREIIDDEEFSRFQLLN
jgi:hypothetical protein